VIEAEADLMNGLVADLLDLSRIQAGAVRPVLAVNTADELIEASLQRAAAALAAHPVHVELPDDALLTARFDVTQSVRVLVNLLENAAKYAPPGTAIVVRASRVGDRVRIAVCDAGPGVPPTERERIFEPFYRPPDVPPDVRGTGLGLSIARGLADAQGGAVRYEDGAAGGSVFVVELPAVDVPAVDDTLVVAR
jgi:two-component system sensor histidine kinase KdpD